MGVQSVYVINKAGGLIYHQDYDGRPKLDLNEYLRVGSVFHAVYVIASQLDPHPATQSSGIMSLDGDTFTLHCFQSPTGVKFVLVTDTADIGPDETLIEIYQTYADYALKSPFYELEMPIRCEKFEERLTAVVRNHNATRSKSTPAVSTTSTSRTSSS
ncbi:trafficking protein particle complex subunit 4 [Pelomyxa schiedti]|nr:trafficking protein particle complex subunit 4 [Pelomyxa schiedti]